MLEKLSSFANRYFAEGSQPAMNTLKSHINKGLLSGRVVAGRYFVETTAWGEPVFYNSTVEAQNQSEQNTALFVSTTSKAHDLLNAWASGR